MKTFFKSKGFIISVLVILCVAILGICWFVNREHTEEFKPDESSSGSMISDWSDGGVKTENSADGAENYSPGQSSGSEEEYPKVVSEAEDEVVIDFTDTERPEETPPPEPESRPVVEGSMDAPPSDTDPNVPTVTAPPAEGSAGGNEPAPGSSNGSGAVYDPVFGWVVPGDVQQSTGGSDGDLNKQVGNMG